MRKGIMMMTAVLAISGFNYHAIAKSSNSESFVSVTDYETKWCSDTSFILRSSLDAAYNAQTFEAEVSILKRAITKTLETLNPKFAYYMDSTLLLALQLEQLATTPKDKTLILRRHINHAIDDLYYLDGRMSNRFRQDHTQYVIKVLTRTEDEALRSKTDQTENMILNTGASSAIQILSDGDNRRDSKIACAVRYLKELQNLDDVFYKRSLISESVNSLKHGCRY